MSPRKKSKFPIIDWMEDISSRHWFNIAPLDYELLTVIVLLNVFGLIMIYSASYYYCSVSELMDNEPYTMCKSQAQNMGIGLVAMIIVSFLDYRRWKEFYLNWIAYGFSIVLIALLLTGFGISSNEATRWLKIGPLPQFQVAEVVKLMLIEFMAVYLDRYTMPYNLKRCVFLFLLISAVAGFLLVCSNNLSSALIIMGICLCLIFASRPGYKFWIGLVAAVVVVAVLGILAVYYNPDFFDGNGFRLSRIVAWLYPEEHEQGTAMQALYSKYAIGYGGLFGRGLGKSLQKYKLPEPYNDFILAIVAEELGFVGIMVLFMLFAYLLYKICKIAINAVDNFGRLFAFGVMCHFGIQVLMNAAVASNSMPTTGVTLPFISAGGSSVIFLMIELGIVFSIDKVRKQEDARRKAKKEMDNAYKKLLRHQIGL